MTTSDEVMKRRWREMTDTTFIEGIIYNPERPYRCCNKEMTIEEDTSAQCYSCGRCITNAVPCATREQCLSNSRIRKPYNRIKYFREWMRHILGYNSCFLTDDQWQKMLRYRRRTLMKDKIFFRYMEAITRFVTTMDGDMPEIQNHEVAQLGEDVINNLRSDYSYTTFIEDDMHFSMTPQRAEDIISFLPEGRNYRIEPTFIKNRDGNWFITESRLPIRHNNKLLPLNRDTNPGALVGIDQYYHDIDYPADVVIYALYELEEPDLNRLQPIRHPGNCVAKLVRSFFSDSNRGCQLTEDRKAAIRKWEQNTNRSGGTIEAIMRLETMLQRRIQVLDIMGGKIYPGTKKYFKMGCPIQIYQHNGHAWREVSFPKRNEVMTYKESPLPSVLKENSIWVLDEE